MEPECPLSCTYTYDCVILVTKLTCYDLDDWGSVPNRYRDLFLSYRF
jgi:hypothetical protein